MKTIMRFLFISLLTILVSACTNTGGFEFPGIYKPELEQGNIFTQDQINLLQPGMSKAQVTYVMGSPLNIDIFQPDQWHYTYILRQDDKVIADKQVTIVFVDDFVTEIIHTQNGSIQ